MGKGSATSVPPYDQAEVRSTFLRAYSSLAAVRFFAASLFAFALTTKDRTTAFNPIGQPPVPLWRDMQLAAADPLLATSSYSLFCRTPASH